ncbi:protein FAM96B [Pseudozyma hubeiensis SY62]|uniref:Protein FAM96B n=1 Tax=Pseudozyma hubeiensis (strain SY62) TaxID=1305764 RepID=R9P669_PSEHS|nr:protein FAM96B [Pseudozyma hubeiensis SY62]GAC96819.1 protein FAM96B [Pseudozyma hubeiensis SY62]
MDQKDNANPIVYQSSLSSAQRRSSSNANAEWWRDHSIHSSAQSAGRASSSSSTSIAGLGSASTSSSNNLASSFARATRSTIDEDDEAELDEADHDDQDQDGDVAMSRRSVTPLTSPETEAGSNANGNGKTHSSASDEQIDSQEIYDLIRSITDPEHPLTLEQLAVVNASHITVSHGDETLLPHVLLEFTPTIPHCSMATLIGLSLRVRLLRALPDRFKVDIRVRPGTHQSENAVNKQLNDKERVAAALENSHLFNVVQGCLASAGRRGKSVDEVAAYFSGPPSGDGKDDQDHQMIWKTVDDITTRMGIAV